MLTTAKKRGATATGALIGAVVAGPLGLGIGAAVGGIVDLVRHHSLKSPAAKGAPAPHVAAKPVSKAFPHVTPQKAVQVATAAAASPPPQAAALYAAIKEHPFDAMLGAQTYGASWLTTPVNAFQSAYNATSASKTTGPLSITGKYDSKTAAALVLFTHDDPSRWSPPFPSDPGAG